MQAPAPHPEIMSTAGYGGEAAIRGQTTFGSNLARAFSDKRGGISRPKLLFAVAGLDLVLIARAGLVTGTPEGSGAKARDDLDQSVVDGHFARHRAKPGVTGWAQANGWRGETDPLETIPTRVERDIYDIDNWPSPRDLFIIALTPLSWPTGKNAY